MGSLGNREMAKRYERSGALSIALGVATLAHERCARTVMERTSLVSLPGPLQENRPWESSHSGSQRTKAPPFIETSPDSATCRMFPLRRSTEGSRARLRRSFAIGCRRRVGSGPSKQHERENENATGVRHWPAMRWVFATRGSGRSSVRPSFILDVRSRSPDQAGRDRDSLPMDQRARLHRPRRGCQFRERSSTSEAVHDRVRQPRNSGSIRLETEHDQGWR